MGAEHSKREKSVALSNVRNDLFPEEASGDFDPFSKHPVRAEATVSDRGPKGGKPKAKKWVTAPLRKPVAKIRAPLPFSNAQLGAGAPALRREQVDPEEHLYDCVAEDWDPREKCYDPNDPSLIIVDADDVLDFCLDEFKSPRALMSCGHAVTPTSLTNWCRRQLDEGKSLFVCGGCKATWSFEEVRKMALLTPEEVDYFARKIFSNSRVFFNIKSCPGCKSDVLRSDRHNLCVRCPVCTVDRKRPFSFCWQCLKEWQGPAPRWDHCDNSGCMDEALETLRNCPEIIFKDMTSIAGCPSIRACPTCGFLLEHLGIQCKNITCSRCKHVFCFVCLEPKEVCKKTSGAYQLCPDGIAPRQARITELPWDKSLIYTSFSPHKRL